MMDTFIKDCVFLPGSQSVPLEEVVAEESRRIQSGRRQAPSIVRVFPVQLDPALFRAAGYDRICISAFESPSSLAARAVTSGLKQNGVEPREIEAFIYYDTDSIAEEWLLKNSPAYRVSIAKAYTARLAMNATLQAINLIGPQSLERGHLIERLFRAAKAFDILEGTGEIQREHIVRNFKPEQAYA